MSPKSTPYDYYTRLGVAKTASNKEIKAAFRRKAKKYHPDVRKGIGTEEAFKFLVEAYAVLKNKKKRAEYNQQLLTDYFQRHVLDPANKRLTSKPGFGYTAAVANDDWGWRVG